MPKDETTTKFKVDISELKANIQEANRQIRLANSEFKAATSGMDKWSESADGISAKLKQLNDVLDGEKKKLKSLEDQYELVVKEQGENSRGAEELRIKINNQKAAIGETEKQIRNYNDRLTEMENGTEEANEETEKSTEGFTVMKSVLADLVASGIKAVINGLKELAKNAKEAYAEFDSGYDNLVKATGATGDTAKELEKSYANVAKSVKGDMSAIGSAVGEVNTRFGYTGEQLEKTSEKFMKFSDITGQDTTQAVQLVSRAMENAGIDSKELDTVLDQLAVAGQASGTSVAKLTENLTKYGTPMREMGLSTEESIAMLAQFEKAGVNTDTMLGGMKKAMQNWAKEGKNSTDEFKNVIKEIQNAPDKTKAAQTAMEVFGNKAGSEFADAVRSGRFEYEDFLDTIKSSGGAVEDTYSQTQDGFDKIQLAAQSLKVGVGEAVKGLLDEYAPEIDDFITRAKQFLDDTVIYLTETLIPDVKNFFDWCIEHLPEIEAAAAGIAAAFLAWQIASVVTAVTTALAGMSAAEVVAAAKTWLLNTALLANPIGILVALLAGLVVAFEVLWNKCDWFREGWISFWKIIQNTAKKAANAINKFFSDALTGIKKVWNGAKSFFSSVWDGIKAVFSTVVTWWSNLFTKAFMAVRDAWNGAVDFFSGIRKGIENAFAIIDSWLEDKFITAFDLIRNAWSGVTAFFKELWEAVKKVFEPVSEFFKFTFELAWTAVKFIWDSAAAFFEIVWKLIKIAFEPAAEWFGEKFTDAWNRVKETWDTVSEFFGEVWSAIRAVFSKVGSWFSEKFTAARNNVNDKFSGIGEWFGDRYEDIKAVFSNVGIWFRNKFADARNKINEKFSDIGAWFSDRYDDIKAAFSNIGTWFRNKFSDARNKTKETFSDIGDWFSDRYEDVKASFNSVSGWFGDKFKEARSNANDAFSNVGVWFASRREDIYRAFSPIADRLRDIFTDAWERIKEPFNGVSSFFDGVMETVRNAFSPIGTTVGDAIGEAFKNAINAVIETVENTLNFIPNKVNPMLQTITDWTGETFPLMPTVDFPRLAKGGVLKKGQIGLLEGSGAEAVVPLEKNTQWLDEIAKRISIQSGMPGGYAYAGAQPVQNVVNNFYQTNNSPKPLSRLEIYRQSKNLLKMKG